ncbi:MAG: ABC transporter permease [Holophagales bacterium]|nr:ABC transporter permease [Holophagales bacterium]
MLNHFEKADSTRAMATVLDYFDRRSGIEAFEEVAVFQNRTHTFGEPGALSRAFSQIVTPSFFQVLGIEPRLGRAFSDAATDPGHPAEAVISSRLWREAFGSDPEILGRELRVEGQIHSILGVLPDTFSFPGWDADLWLVPTIAETPGSEAALLRGGYEMIARLRPGARLETAARQLDAQDAVRFGGLPAVVQQRLDEAGFSSSVVGFHEHVVGEARRWILLLWGGGAFVLAVALVSLANLQLVHLGSRLGNLATRHALGAAPGRLLSQLTAEGALLGALAGGLGIAAGGASLRVLRRFEAYEIPRIEQLELGVGHAVALWLVGTLAVAGTACVTSWPALRRDALARLGSLTRSRDARGAGWSGVFVATQVAVATVLLSGAALLVVSLHHLEAVDLGFESRAVSAGAVSLPGDRYGSVEAQQRFYGELERATSGLGGVERVAFGTQLPFSGPESTGTLLPRTPTADLRADQGEELAIHHATVVSDGFFETLGIPLVTGRGFGHGDDSESPRVLIVSRSVAERYWSPETAVGQEVDLGSLRSEAGPSYTVVGVVEDIVQDDLAAGISQGAFYLSGRQHWMGFSRVVVRARDEEAPVLASVRDAILGLDPELALFWVLRLDDAVAGSLLSRRVPMQVLSGFSLLAVLLAAVGIFGVLSRTISGRIKEIGIRFALGSSRQRICGWALGSLAPFVAVGLIVGVVAALLLGRLLESLVFGVSPTEPWVLVATALAILGVGLTAAALPALRASRVDPVEVLAVD